MITPAQIEFNRIVALLEAQFGDAWHMMIDARETIKARLETETNPATIDALRALDSIR